MRLRLSLVRDNSRVAMAILLRGCALLLGLAAHPANPFAPAVLVLVAVLMAMGDTAGQLSTSG